MIQKFIFAYLFFTFVCHASPKDAFLGIAFSEFTREGISTIKVDYIVPDSAASTHDIHKNDLIYMMDYQPIPSKNAGAYFKQHIESKAPGDSLVLHIIRKTLAISKKIDDVFIDTLHSFGNIQSDIESLDFSAEETFKFQKKVSKKVLTIKLDLRPNMLQSTPNVELLPEYSFSFREPFIIDFFDNLKKNEAFLNAFATLSKGQLENEFWDDGLRFSVIRNLHVNYHHLPAFISRLDQELLQHNAMNLFDLHNEFFEIKQSSPTVTYPVTARLEDHLAFIDRQYNLALKDLEMSLKDLSTKERMFIYNFFPNLLNHLRHNFMFSLEDNFSDASFSRFFTLLKRINAEQLLSGAAHLYVLSNESWLDTLQDSLSEIKPFSPRDNDIEGNILFRKTFTWGDLVIGSSSDNIYKKDLTCIIDFGGDDVYLNNAGGTRKSMPVTVLIDFEGDDYYSSAITASQGAALLGYGMLIDLEGNDVYRAHSVGQGSAFGGAALFIDHAGDDSYISHDFSQGLAGFGAAVFYDLEGNDRYSSRYFAQGVGLTAGVGLLHDSVGNDTYFLGGYYKSSYGTPGIFKAAGQGFGFGFRHFSSGGIGILYDAAGNDSYEAGNFSQGSGFYYGFGTLFDRNGDDLYTGSRYSMGAAAHSAIGVLADKRGNDRYKPLYGVSIAAAWDNSNAYFVDYAGDDSYLCQKLTFCVSQAEHNSFALFNDKFGRDFYEFDDSKPIATNSYNGGKSVALFIDEGGANDLYGFAEKNNTINTKNSSYVFVDLSQTLQEFLHSELENDDDESDAI